MKTKYMNLVILTSFFFFPLPFFMTEKLQNHFFFKKINLILNFSWNFASRKKKLP
jgi:hypothetical protein